MKKLDPKLRRLIQSQSDSLMMKRDLEAAVTTTPDLTRNDDGTFPEMELHPTSLFKRCLVMHRWKEIPENYRSLSWLHVVGDIYTVNVPLSLLESLGNEPGVDFVEAGRSFSPMLVSSIDETGASTVHTGPHGLSGKDVIVGIIDSGLDYTLDDFRRSDGSTRVAFLWDQSLEPMSSERSPEGFTYGVEYSADTIDGMMNGTAEVRHEFSVASHGTHVAGIAAGNGRGSDEQFETDKYVGAAPEATIIHVTPFSNDQDSTFTDSTNVADAIAYIFRKADELGSPCVINMSLGQNGGSHDGESVVERAIDQLLQVPGRAFISAAGNEHVWRGHASGVLETGEQRTLRWKAGGQIPWQDSPFNGSPLPPPEYGDFSPNEMEIWFSSRDIIRVRVQSPGGEVTPWLAAGESNLINMENGNGVFIDVERFTVLNGEGRIYIEVEPITKIVEEGVWLVELEGVEIRDGQFDAFIERDYRQHIIQLNNGQEIKNFFADQSFFVGTDFEPHVTLGTPATSKRGIAVANYDHTSQSPNLSSSRGPTRDGRPKPEVAAPGTSIVAANAHGGEPDGFGGTYPVRVAKTGTSMSAPHVTGIVALLLEHSPDLTSAQTQNILIASARSETGSNEFDPAWGYGAVDAEAAINLLKNM